MLVHRNNGQYGITFSTPCSNGKDNDKYTVWLDVQFKRGQEPNPEQNNFYINVKSFFMSAYKTKDGVVHPKMVIMEWEYDADKAEEYRDAPTGQQPMSNISSDDLPF